MHSTLIQLVLTYKYAILIPMAFLEGHVITLIAGFLARLGYINPVLAGVCVAFGNLLGDMALYWLGYAQGMRAVRRFGKFLGVTEEGVEKVRGIFHRHTSRILFVSKLTNGFGLAVAVLFTAGLTRIPFRSYMVWNILGECIWTGILISFGFFLGDLYTVVDTVVWRIGVVSGCIVGVIILFKLAVFLIKQRI